MGWDASSAGKVKNEAGGGLDRRDGKEKRVIIRIDTIKLLAHHWLGEFMTTGEDIVNSRVNFRERMNKRLATAAVALLLSCQTFAAALAAGPVSETALRSAWALYTQQKYRESSDAFEQLIASSTPSARLYYYAALANRACNRTARAKQLCQYISTTFASSPEAAYAQKLYPSAAPQTASSSGGSGEGEADEVPASLKGLTAEQLLQSEEGRNYIKHKAERQLASAKVSPMLSKSKGGRQGERVFTPADIAREGANGIDQMYYPNCWFESTMSTLAQLPRGQRLMADMVRYGPKEGTYVVRFPGDGNEYNITEKLLEEKGIHNKALWATLIECGQVLKFPHDNGNLLSEGLACLTGQKAHSLDPEDASEQELSSFIDGAVKSQNPIICATHNYIPSGMPYIVETNHAYTIIGFEPSSGMIKIRNPHGANSRRFSLKNDARHEKFEMMDDGVFKIHMSLFKKYFDEVARANI
jgi:hypothetical protein